MKNVGHKNKQLYRNEFLYGVDAVEILQIRQRIIDAGDEVFPFAKSAVARNAGRGGEGRLRRDVARQHSVVGLVAPTAAVRIG